MLGSFIGKLPLPKAHMTQALEERIQRYAPHMTSKKVKSSSAHFEAVKNGKIVLLSENLREEYKKNNVFWQGQPKYMQPVLRTFEWLSNDDSVAQIIEDKTTITFEDMLSIVENHYHKMPVLGTYGMIIKEMLSDFDNSTRVDPQAFAYIGTLPRRVEKVDTHWHPSSQLPYTQTKTIDIHFKKPISRDRIFVIGNIAHVEWPGLQLGERGDWIIEQVYSTGEYAGIGQGGMPEFNQEKHEIYTGHRPIFSWSKDKKTLSVHLHAHPDPSSEHNITYHLLALQSQFFPVIEKNIKYEQ